MILQYTEIVQHCVPGKGLDAEEEGAKGQGHFSTIHLLVFIIISSIFLQISPRDQALGHCLFLALRFSARRQPPIRPCDESRLLRRLRRSLTGVLHPIQQAPPLSWALEVVLTQGLYWHEESEGLSSASWSSRLVSCPAWLHPVRLTVEGTLPTIRAVSMGQSQPTLSFS